MSPNSGGEPQNGCCEDHAAAGVLVLGSEVLAVGFGRVSLVPTQCVRGCPRPARAAAQDPELVQQRWQRRRITRIAGRQDQDKWQPTAVDQCMGLGRQATAGTTDGVIVRFVPATQRFFVIRPSPLCERSPQRQTSQQSPRAGERG